MKKYKVQYTHVFEQQVTCIVEAISEEEAKEKARDGEYDFNTEETSPEDGLEIKDIYILKEL